MERMERKFMQNLESFIALRVPFNMHHRLGNKWRTLPGARVELIWINTTLGLIYLRDGEVVEQCALPEDELSWNLSCINKTQILSQHHPFSFPFPFSPLQPAVPPPPKLWRGQSQSALIAFASGHEFFNFMRRKASAVIDFKVNVCH